MHHVFVETNWLHDYAAPAHHKVPEAVTLLERAQRGSVADRYRQTRLWLLMGMPLGRFKTARSTAGEQNAVAKGLPIGH